MLFFCGIINYSDLRITLKSYNIITQGSQLQAYKLKDPSE